MAHLGFPSPAITAEPHTEVVHAGALFLSVDRARAVGL